MSGDSRAWLCCWGPPPSSWPVFVVKAQREGEQVFRCNGFDQQTKAGAGLCLMYTWRHQLRVRLAKRSSGPVCRVFSVVSVSLPRQSSLGSLGPVLSSSSVGLLQVLLGVLGTQPPTPRTAPRHSAQASPVKALAVAGLHPRGQRSAAEAGVGGKPVQKSRLRSICFLSTVCRELPMGGSCRKVWGARPHADLQGPEAGTATLSGQGRPTDSGPSWGGVLPFQEPFLVIELASPREGELGTMRVQTQSAK